MRFLIVAAMLATGCASIQPAPNNWTWTCHTDIECMKECMERGFEFEYCDTWDNGE